MKATAQALFILFACFGFVVVSAMIFHLMTGELVITLIQ